MLGVSLIKTADSFIEYIQTISEIPARIRITHAIIANFK